MGNKQQLSRVYILYIVHNLIIVGYIQQFFNLIQFCYYFDTFCPDLHNMRLILIVNALMFRVPALSFQTKCANVAPWYGQNSITITIITTKDIPYKHYRRFLLLISLFIYDSDTLLGLNCSKMPLKNCQNRYF